MTQDLTFPISEEAVRLLDSERPRAWMGSSLSSTSRVVV